MPRRTPISRAASSRTVARKRSTAASLAVAPSPAPPSSVWPTTTITSAPRFPLEAALDRISNTKVPREHFTALDRALRSARVYGNVVAANLGELSYPDLVAEIADLLLGFDRAKFVLCAGRFGTKAFLSLRTDAPESRAGTLMREIIDARGAAGGHG